MNAVLQPSLSCRPMQAADLDAVMLLEAAAYPFPWSRGNFADSLRAGYRAWVCEEQELIIGYGLLTVILDEAQLLNITVAPRLHGRGLGGELLGYLLDDARSCNAERMFLEVRPSNQPALALYQRRGFIPVGRRKGYYPAAGGREDAIVMAREL